LNIFEGIDIMQTMQMPDFGTVEQREELFGIIAKYAGGGGSLINVLQDAQDLYGYLPLEVQKMVARQMEIPIEEVYSTATFYHQFSMVPQGKYKINVCIGTACYVKGAGDVLNEFARQLNVDVGVCSDDGMFQVVGCRCIGVCGLAPVLTVNEDVHGKIYKDDVGKVLAQYLPKDGEAE